MAADLTQDQLQRLAALKLGTKTCSSGWACAHAAQDCWSQSRCTELDSHL